MLNCYHICVLLVELQDSDFMTNQFIRRELFRLYVIVDVICLAVGFRQQDVLKTSLWARIKKKKISEFSCLLQGC